MTIKVTRKLAPKSTFLLQKLPCSQRVRKFPLPPYYGIQKNRPRLPAVNQANPTTGSRDKVVALVTGLWRGDTWNRDLISQRGKRFTFLSKRPNGAWEDLSPELRP